MVDNTDVQKLISVKILYIVDNTWNKNCIIILKNMLYCVLDTVLSTQQAFVVLCAHVKI